MRQKHVTDLGSIKAAQFQAKTYASSRQAIGMWKPALEPTCEAHWKLAFVKIVYTERVQDGVERLGYAVGFEAVKAVQKQETLLWKVSEVTFSSCRQTG